MNAIPNGWAHTTFGDCIQALNNGVNAPQNRQGVGKPVTRIETIANGEIDLARLGYIKPDPRRLLSLD